MRHPHDVELPVRVDRADPAPLPAQLVQQLRELVVSGTLRPGDALPSTRGLAARLGISRGSVVTAYDQLHGEGYLRLSYALGDADLEKGVGRLAALLSEAE